MDKGLIQLVRIGTMLELLIERLKLLKLKVLLLGILDLGATTVTRRIILLMHV